MPTVDVPGDVKLASKQTLMFQQESLVKSLSMICILFIDCGEASRRTQGGTGVFIEPGLPPFIRAYFE
jgi:hypothetical protein